MHWSTDPALRRFTLEERDRRWRRVRELMAAQHIDLLLVLPQSEPADALYLAGVAGAVFFPLEGEPFLLIGGEASDRAVAHEAWIKDRASATSRGSTRVAYGQAIANQLKAMHVERQRVAIVGLHGDRYAHVRRPDGYLIHSTMVDLLAAIPEATVVDGTPIIGEARYVKTPEELGVLRESVRIAEASAELMVRQATPGTPQRQVWGEMLLDQIMRQVQEPMVAWCPGGWGEPKLRYTTAPPGIIQPGLRVATEISPSVLGYRSQVAEALVVGPPNAQEEEIFELNVAMFQRACQLMRPGNTWRQVYDGVGRVLAGTPYAPVMIIHGQGLGDDGPLFIPTDTHGPLANDPLRANTVLVVKPGAHPRGVERVMRSHDVTWGDTVVVREGGAERLGTRPMALQQVD